jgi:hypothetical protein
MALENSEVLQNLKTQLEQVVEQLNTLTNTRIRLLGAIEILQQIEDSKIESTESPVGVGDHPVENSDE